LKENKQEPNNQIKHTKD